MKFKGIVIGLLSVILALNAVMAGILITEAKKQSELAITQLNLIRYQNRYQIEMYGDDGTFWIDAINKADTLLDKIESGE